MNFFKKTKLTFTIHLIKFENGMKIIEKEIYIHCSTLEEMKDILEKYYPNKFYEIIRKTDNHEKPTLKKKVKENVKRKK